MEIRTAEHLRSHVGRELAVGDWHVITQQRVDDFAAVSGDNQWIHVDGERAARSRFGGTIAHGFLVLSMGPVLRGYEMALPIRYGLNYGLNRVRFPAPVPVGSRVRLRTSVASVDDIAPGQIQFALRHTAELEDGVKPGMVAEQVTRYFLDDGS